MVLVPFPFYEGMTERIDPRMFPKPGLKKIENGRVRKEGRIGKKYGNAEVPTTNIPTVAAGKYPQAIVDHFGTPTAVVGDIIRVRYGSSSSDWVRRGKVSRWLPWKMFTVARSETASLINPTAVASNGKVLYFCSNGTNTIYYRFTKPDGTVLDQNVGGSGTLPRAVTAGSTSVRVVYRDGTNVVQYGVNTSPAVPVITSGGTVGTLSTSTAMCDAAPFDSTNHLVVWQSAVNTLTVALVTSSATIAASRTITIVGEATALSVMGTSGENIYVAWVESTGAVRAQAFNVTLSATTSAIVTLETVAGAVDHQPNMIRVSSTSVGIVYGAYTTTSGGYGNIAWTTFSNAGSVGSISKVYNCRPASRPFDALSGSPNKLMINVWVHTDNSGPSDTNAQWDANRGYFLLMLEANSPAYSLMMTGDPLVPSDPTTLSEHLPDVASDSSGFYVGLPSVLRSASYATELTGIDALTFTSSAMSLREAYRAHTKAAPATYFAGGLLLDFYGTFSLEAFAHAPAINATAVAAGGSLSAGSYQYCVVYEYLDSTGRRWRSAPSEVVTVTAALNDKVTLTIATYAFNGDWVDRYVTGGTDQLFGRITAHVYRTKAGQTTFYRVTPNIGAPDAAPYVSHAPTISYEDTRADSALGTETLYTVGGVHPNVLPPACRYVATVRNRVVIGGLFESNKVIVSKLLVNGEPAQFSDNAAFAIYVPEDVTAVAGLDDAIVIFAEDSLFMVYGEGPNDQGIGAYALPRRLPSNVGCIDHRSVVETPDGIMFQSKHGIYLLPRGFGPPVFIGADVQETLATYPVVQSATLCREQGSGASALPEATVRFIVGSNETPSSTRILIYDLRSRAWTVDDNDVAMGIGGSWDDMFTFAIADMTGGEPIRSESYTAWGNTGDFVTTKLRTCEIQPFGFAGWGRIRSVVVFGEQRSDADMIVAYSIDGAAPVTETFPITESAGAAFRRELILSTQIQTSLQLDIYDSAGATVPSEGLAFHGLFLDVEPEEGLVRLPEASRG